jgi:ABC-type transport system substrate-binding protein
VINPQYNGESSKIKEISFVFFNNESELLIAAQKKQVQSFVLTLPESLKSLEKNKYQLRLFQLPRYFAVFFNPKNSSVLSSQKVRQALNYGTRKQELIDKVLDGQAKTVDSPLLPDIFGLEAPKTVYEFSLDKAKELLEQDGFKINPQTGFREKTIQKNLTFEFKSTLSKGSQGVEVKELQKCLAKDPAIYPEGEITGVFGDKTKQAVIRFQEKYRQDVLEPSDLDKGNGEVGVLTRKKLNDLCIGPKQQVLELKFSLLTVDDPDLLSDDFLSETTEILKNQWKALGVNVETRSYDFSKLNMDYIKPRAYDALLFGEVLGEIPDPLPFWHSLQKKDPGVNLAVYENKDVDALLEQARQTFDEGQRKEKLGQLQDILLQDAPAVFLYRPNFLYLTSGKIKGVETGLIVDPSKRFSGITEWYINTKKVWK